MDKEQFENVIIYSYAEPGAMGAGGYMCFFTEEGDEFSICYLSDETPYQEIKDAFPALRDCYWNGPMKSRSEKEPREIVIYLDGEPALTRTRTKITEGWQHVYTGYGNHLAIRDDHSEEFMNEISDLQDEVDIYGEWLRRARKLYGKK